MARHPDRIEVIVVGAERIHPYERPPLSKGVLLGTSELADCLLWKPGDQAWAHVTTHLGVSVEEIDRMPQRIRLSDDTVLAYDQLVLANGSHIENVPPPGAGLVRR